MKNFFSLTPENTNFDGKNRVTAGLLAFFLGGLGVHDFYLGRKTQGAVKIIFLVSGVFLILPLLLLAIWTILDLIEIFTCKDFSDDQQQGSTTSLERIEKAHDLFERGIISEEEFKAIKEKSL